MEEIIQSDNYTILLTVKLNIEEDINMTTLIHQAIAQAIDDYQKEILNMEYFK